MKKMQIITRGYKYPEKAGLRDKIQIVNSFLFLILGVILGSRLLSEGIFSPVLLLIDAGFLLLGGYRVYHILRYFRQKGGADG